VILWWLILFLLLPIGVKKQESVDFGNDPGAPKNPMLKKKFILTTIISFFITIIIIIVKNEIF
jgi:predicted secreted protein